jgi:hypothetical protein
MVFAPLVANLGWGKKQGKSGGFKCFRDLPMGSRVFLLLFLINANL